MHLVLIETSGNQRYIFASNKLREAVGASELTHRAGTQWVLEAVEAAGGPALWRERGVDRDGLLDPAVNRSAADGAPVEVVVATSGKALLLVRDDTTGRAIVRRVTDRALEEAPGLDVTGVVGQAFDWEHGDLDDAVREVHQVHARHRQRRSSPASRFLRIPLVADCATTGMPAARFDHLEPEPGLRSATASAKRAAAKKAKARLQRLLDVDGTTDEARRRFVTDIDELETVTETGWLAVVHADGNGLGALFQNFGEVVPGAVAGADRNASHADLLRRFSLGVERCTERAFVEALDVLVNENEEKNKKVAVVPLVLGGDDLTVLCHGPKSIAFTAAYLQAFETATADRTLLDGVVPELVERKHGHARLSAAAGVAVTKSHFPFWSAYQLSTQLIEEAKTVKQQVVQDDRFVPTSALDFHVLYDSSDADLDRIREDLRVDDRKTLLTARPYVVTSPDALGGAGAAWRRHRQLDDLRDRVELLTERDEDGYRIPRSQLHELREGLFLGHEEADSRLNLVRERLPDVKRLCPNGTTTSLFTTPTQGSERRMTVLLDALDLAVLEEESRR